MASKNETIGGLSCKEELLRFFREHPGEEYRPYEIVRLIGHSSRSVRNALPQLANEGILEKRTESSSDGPAAYYRMTESRACLESPTDPVEDHVEIVQNYLDGAVGETNLRKCVPDSIADRAVLWKTQLTDGTIARRIATPPE